MAAGATAELPKRMTIEPDSESEQNVCYVSDHHIEHE